MKSHVGFIFVILFIYSCQPKTEDSSQENNEQQLAAEAAYEVRLIQYLNSVCSPFDDDVNIPGIRAKLYQGAPNSQVLDDFMVRGKLINENIYLSKLAIEPRNFTKGFEQNSGEMLKDENGDVLVEWFGLDMESYIKLRDDQEEGYYTFMSNIDDGFELDLLSNNEWQRAIGYDAWTPPKYHCYTTKEGSQSVAFRFTADTILKMKARYFQGPRYHISMELYMKKVADLDAHSDEVVSVSIPKCDCNKDEYTIMEEENFGLQLANGNPCEEPNPNDPDLLDDDVVNPDGIDPDNISNW